MDMYNALKPIHLFWKCTGMASYSLIRNKKDCPRYIPLKSDKAITTAIITIFAILNIANIYSETFDNVLSMTETMKRCAYNVATLFSLVAMYCHKQKVIKSIENLVDINDRMKTATSKRESCGKTKRKVEMIIIIYFILAVMAFSYEVLYENRIYSYPVMHYVYYYTNHVITVSGLTMLLFYLIEIKRVFCALNNQLKTDIYIVRIHVAKIRRARKKVEELLRINRLLRNTSKRVNKIFQVLLLGKVVIAWMFTLSMMFKLTSNLAPPLKYYQEVYMIWSSIHVAEIAIAIRLFTSVKYEVTILNILLLLLPFR